MNIYLINNKGQKRMIKRDDEYPVEIGEYITFNNNKRWLVKNITNKNRIYIKSNTFEHEGYIEKSQIR